MASELELTSFLIKFKQLCNAGLEASLLMKSTNGIASVSLEVTLGALLESSPKADQYVASVTKKKRKRSPAYYRRQDLRRNARMSSFSDESTNAAVEVNIGEKGANTCTSEVKKVTVNAEADVADRDQTDESMSDELDTELEEGVIKINSDSMMTATEMDVSEQLDSLIKESRRNRDIWDQQRYKEQNTGIS